MRPKNLLKARLVIPIVLCLLSATALAQTNTRAASTPTKDFASSIDVVKDVVNIIFFLTLGVIGVLSYLQARKTIFTPMKTETFKLQLKLFEDMILFFEEFKQKGADHTLHLREILEVNSALLLDAYVRQFFKPEKGFPDEVRAKLLKDYPRAIVSLDRAADWKLVDDYIEMEKTETKSEVVDPAVLLAQWEKYKYGPIHYSNAFHDLMIQLDHFHGSPLVPTQIKQMVTEFQEEALKNLGLVGDVLTSVAQELPEKYPNTDSLSKVRYAWIWNKYTNKRSLIKKLPDKILEHINQYLDVEHILG